MGKLVTVACCNLNQWVNDWNGNRERVLRSIREAKAAGARYRSGPELELCGYSQLDHFLENDTYLHSMEQLAIILQDNSIHDIICDIGMPILHRGDRLNCRVLILNSKILFVRPKLWLANDGEYREMRYFIPWVPFRVEEFQLPEIISELQGSTKVPIGDMLLSTLDTCISIETCEELFTPQAPSITASLNGAELFINSSASHHSLRKLEERLSLIQAQTHRLGGCYLYSNMQGMDGDGRLYFDGCSMIFLNGEILVQGSQFSLNDVEVVCATVDLDSIRAFRYQPSRGAQSMSSPTYQRVECSFSLGRKDDDLDHDIAPTKPQPSLRLHSPEEQISLSAACFLYDYLNRSGQAGFLLPLSGGLDSCSTSLMVFAMCREVCKALDQGNTQVQDFVKRIAVIHGEEEWSPKSPQDLCSRVLHTVFMGMSKQSSKSTRSRAQQLSASIGSDHLDMNIDKIYNALVETFTESTGHKPTFQTDDLMLQNLQARSRMLSAYMYAQGLPNVPGNLLVLGSANVDEALRGYYTKYDCSSADINPLGGISKTDLRRFLAFAQTEFDLPILQAFLDATPSAELRPIDEGQAEQSDEIDMGMSYRDLSVFGKLRKEQRLGPFGMFQRLVHDWDCSPRETAQKVKHFFHSYAINRHKMTTLTPSLHMEDYSPDDNRFDLRPFVYFPFYKSFSFARIDEEVTKMEERARKKAEAAAKQGREEQA